MHLRNIVKEDVKEDEHGKIPLFSNILWSTRVKGVSSEVSEDLHRSHNTFDYNNMLTCNIDKRQSKENPHLRCT